MEGIEFDLYNKCLFKTINYNQLKSELLSRNINFSPSDTYPILTLRMRKDILEKLHIQHSVVQNIDSEIKLFEKVKYKSTSGYRCSFPGCSFQNLQHKRYVYHLQNVHHNSKSRLVCQFRHECTRDFPTVQMLRMHITRDHQRRESSVVLNQNQLVEQITTLKCLENSCGHQSVSSILTLKKHIFSHTDKKEDTKCIFCSYKTNVTGTLKSHISRKHKIQTVSLLNPDIVELRHEEDGACYSGNPEESRVSARDEVNTDDHLEDLSSEDDENEVEGTSDLDEEVFVKALSITMNTWMNISGIAYSTVNNIVVELFNSYEKGVEYSRQKIEKVLRSEDVKMDEDRIKEILNTVADRDPFLMAKKELEKESSRKRYINRNFPNVQPETVNLSDDEGGKPDTYQYVPIQDSLRLLLEDDTYIKQKLEDPYCQDEDVVKDTRDGVAFKENPFFRDNPDAIGLIVFVDELEICNPLGAAKTRHKINCSYYSLVQIQPALRSKVQSIQLVSLVTSKVWKKHGNAECNAKFISDLKVLEDLGMKIMKPFETTLKVGLAYIIGDNLGQHNLMEYSQCFSSGPICRWCHTTYNEACKKGLIYSGSSDEFKPKPWTIEDYDTNAGLAEEAEGVIDTCGIKKRCTFNQLKSFHCIRQLPPCLGHDYYEGVYSYDIQFYLDYLINKEKLLDAETFNKKLKAFKLSERDAKNRPREFKTRKKGSKYEGNAGSIRILSRIVTMILSNCLGQSEVGENIIKLQEISELITAPKLNYYEINNKLHYSIIEYLDLRRAAIEEFGMDNMKPKHHFISHYSEFYSAFGPLIFLWAMRMEAKHCFFKNCIRTSKNFKNVTKTCASRHQMAQITYAYSGLFPRKLEIPDSALTKKEIMKINPEPFLQSFLAKFKPDVLVPAKLRIFGTIYEPGMVLVLSKQDFGEVMKVGLLRAIAIDQEQVIFGCVCYEAWLSSDGFYVTTKKISELEVKSLSELADHQPLHRIGSADNFSFCLHHYVTSSC